MVEAKSFDIARREVWEAYKRVKANANRGAGGVDGVSIAEFEQDLRNLYRIWNRMASGSYFPPPVKRVHIPKCVFQGIVDGDFRASWTAISG
jgi:RNA-directed DNA polymerase